MDGIRKRPAVGGSLAGVLPALHRASGFLEPVAEDDPKARGQPVDPRRRDHPRRERRPSSEKGRSRPPAEERDSSGRRAADVSRLGRGAAVLRLDMPQTPPLPSSTPGLSASVTHRFPRRGLKMGGRPALESIVIYAFEETATLTIAPSSISSAVTS